LEKLWENIWFRLLTFLLFGFLFLLASYYFRGILIPLVFAFIIAYIFDPIVDYLQKFKVPRAATIALLLLAIFGLIAGALIVIIPDFIQETVQLAETVQNNIPKIQTQLQQTFGNYSGHPIAQTLSEYARSGLGTLQKNMPQILKTVESVLTGALTYTFSFVGVIVNFLLFSVVSVYLLKDFHLVTTKMEDLVPLQYRSNILQIIGKMNDKLRGFFRGQLVVGTILTAFYFVGLLLVGVPYALLLALVGGYGQIIPYMGIILAMIPAMLLALVKYGDLTHPLLAGGVYVLGQMLEGTVITPRVMADKVGLHPVVVILSILVFGKILGFLGILIAIPLTTVLLVLLQEILHKYKHSELYGTPTFELSEQPKAEAGQKVTE
jgi:predicted PurR-regulated permease PerM